jgi:transcriptional regulator with XRE-family HTH domain
MEPSPGRRRLGAALRALRARSGLSGAALGQALGWTQTQVSRTELGQRPVSAEDVSRWAEATGAPPGASSELEALLDQATRELRSWWDVHAAGMTRRQQEIASLERRAERISNFQLVVPGLLQTADYARRALALADVSDQRDVAAAVAARMRRQEILYDPARRFDYVLPESALHWDLAGGRPAMQAQADRLISVDSLPNVSVAVLPFTATPPILPTSGFVIYEVPGEPLVLIETLTDELLFGGSREVAAYRSAFAGLQAAAVTGEDAHALIRAAMITER